MSPRRPPSTDPPVGPRPRQARGAAVRSRIYREAMRQFAANGVAETHVEDVVAAAGVAWGTFFRWFPRKQDVLLEGAVLHLRERVMPQLAAGLADPGRDARELARTFFVALLEPGEHPPSVHGALLHEVVLQRERFAAMLDAGDTPLIVAVADVLERGQARGEVRTDLDRFTLAGALITGAAYPVIYGYYGAFRGFPGAEPAADVRALIERFFAIAWRGVDPAPEPLPPAC